MLKCNFPVEIQYYPDVNVNGFDFPRPIIKLLTRQYNQADYFCCGNGALGFNLLHKNIAKKVRFIDCFAPAIKGCQLTAELNGWSKQTDFASKLSDNDSSVDLFIGDPPWWPEVLPGPELNQHQIRQFFDQNYDTHKTMWTWLVDHLTPDADVFIVRDNKRINVQEWKSLIPPELKIQNEYPLKFFNPVTNNQDTKIIKIINSGTVVHLTRTSNA